MVAELEKLASVINGRTVCVLGLGPSLGELDKWIQRFKNKDICWVSLNDIRAPRMILNKIGKYATTHRLATYFQDIKFDKYPPVSDMEKIKEFVEYYKKSDPNVIRY